MNSCSEYNSVHVPQQIFQHNGVIRTAENELIDPKGPEINYYLYYDGLQGDFLGLPHGS